MGVGRLGWHSSLDRLHNKCHVLVHNGRFITALTAEPFIDWSIMKSLLTNRQCMVVGWGRRSELNLKSLIFSQLIRSSLMCNDCIFSGIRPTFNTH